MAGLNPGPDIISRREEPFTKLRNDLTADQAVDLARLYFDLPGEYPDGHEWVREAFAETDESFTMVDNKRELAVLAYCLLAAGTQDGLVAAGLAPLITAVAGNRSPIYKPELLDDLTDDLNTLAVRRRDRASIDAGAIRQPAAFKLNTKAEDITDDWAELTAVLRNIGEQSRTNTANLANGVYSVLRPLVQQFHEVREEVDLLWWHLGGSSRVLDLPFCELDIALASAMAGLDMALLTSSPPGGVSAPAILQRTIDSGRKNRSGRSAARKAVTIREAVDAFPSNRFNDLIFGEELEAVDDVCVVLGAFKKASEIGPGPAWYGAFQRTTGLSEDAEFSPLGLAMQVYREAMLLRLLE